MEIRKKKNISIFLVSGYIFILSFILAMQSRQAPYSKSVFGKDSCVFKTIALVMKKGLMPYKDSFDHKGPLLYILNYFGMEISYEKGIWIFELISITITLVAIYRIARFLCGRVYSCLTLLTVGSLLFKYLEGGNLTEEYAMPFIAVSLYIFSDYFINEKISSLRLFFCGFSFGAVCLLRVNMISLWAVFCIAVLIDSVYNKQIRKLWNFLLYFLIGVLVIAVPILLWLFANHAFTDFWRDYIIFNQSYIQTNFVNKWNSFSFFFNNTLMLLSIMSLFYIIRTKQGCFPVAYIFYYFTTLILICISGQAYSHYGMILVPLISYPIANLFMMLEKSKTQTLVGIFGGICFVASIIFPVWWEGTTNVIKCYAERTKEIHRDFDDIVELILDETDENDQIIVWGNWGIIYVLTQRLPASKYSYQFPIANVDTNIYDEFFEELEKNMPQFIIIEPRVSLGKMEDFLSEHLEYQYMGEIGGGGIYQLSSG